MHSRAISGSCMRTICFCSLPAVTRRHTMHTHRHRKHRTQRRSDLPDNHREALLLHGACHRRSPRLRASTFRATAAATPHFLASLASSSPSPPTLSPHTLSAYVLGPSCCPSDTSVAPAITVRFSASHAAPPKPARLPRRTPHRRGTHRSTRSNRHSDMQTAARRCRSRPTKDTPRSAVANEDVHRSIVATVRLQTHGLVRRTNIIKTAPRQTNRLARRASDSVDVRQNTLTYSHSSHCDQSTQMRSLSSSGSSDRTQRPMAT